MKKIMAVEEIMKEIIEEISMLEKTILVIITLSQPMMETEIEKIILGMIEEIMTREETNRA